MLFTQMILLFMKMFHNKFWARAKTIKAAAQGPAGAVPDSVEAVEAKTYSLLVAFFPVSDEVYSIDHNKESHSILVCTLVDYIAGPK